MKIRLGALLAVSLGVAVLIPLLLGGRDVFALLATVKPATLALLLGMVVIGWNLNAGRLRLLSAGYGLGLGQGRALAYIMATEFAVCVTPAGGGGAVVYPWLLSRHGLAKSRGLALYAADHVMDMLFFLAALCVVLLHSLVASQFTYLGWQLGVTALLLVVPLLLLWLLIEHFRQVFHAVGRFLLRLGMGSGWRWRLARHSLEFFRSLHLIRSYSRMRLAAIFLLCSGHWLLRYSILYFAILAVGESITWDYAFIVQMLAQAAGQLTILPGGSGGIEVSSSLLLIPHIGVAAATSAILLWRFVTFHWYLIAGAPVFALLAGKTLWRLLAGREVLQLGAEPAGYAQARRAVQKEPL